MFVDDIIIFFYLYSGTSLIIQINVQVQSYVYILIVFNLISEL